MRYFIIGDEDAVLGFGLVGVEGRAVRNAEQAQEAQEGQQMTEEIAGTAEVAGQVGEAAGKLRDGLSVIQGGKAA